MDCGFKLQQMIYAAHKGGKQERENMIQYMEHFCDKCPYYYGDADLCMYGEQFINDDGLIEENKEM